MPAFLCCERLFFGEIVKNFLDLAISGDFWYNKIVIIYMKG